MRVTCNEANFYDYCFEYGFNGIPLKKGEKIPHIRWKQYQKRKVTGTETSTWFKRYGDDFNIGIVTGQISRLVVVDVDDLSKLPALMEIMPEIGRTAATKTPRPGAHFLFSTDKPVQSTNNFLDLGIELKGEGAYVVVPVSVVNGTPYLFKARLDYMQPFPQRFLTEVKPVIESRFQLPPKTATKEADCIYQIADRPLVPEEERDKGLFVLFNLLVQNGNKPEYSKNVIRHKNKSLSEPLPDKELEYVWKKRYKFSCQKVRETLPFIKCENCKYLDTRCKVNNLLIQNLSRFDDLSGTDHKVLNYIQYYFDGEVPSISKLSRVSKMDWRTVKNVVERLQKNEII